MQNEIAKAEISGNWSSPSLQAALEAAKEKYPEQNRYSGLHSRPDLIQLVEKAIAEGKSTFSPDDIQSIDPSDIGTQCFLGDRQIQM